MMAVVGEGVLSPRWGWDFMEGRNPALTHWAIIWRPSGPGAGAWGRTKFARSGRFPGIGRRLSWTRVVQRKRPFRWNRNGLWEGGAR
jgi:hypothetical protein